MSIPAFIHVDTDGSWAIMKHFGLPVPPLDSPDIVFESGLERLGSLFRELGIPASFFVIGRDLEHATRQARLKGLASEGHELANHSDTHPEGFALLSREEKIMEVKECGRKIDALTGKAPIGFRAPNFEADPATFEILENLGYQYDSSIFPTVLAYPLRLFHRLRTKGQGSPAYLGMPGNESAPLAPYHLHPPRPYRRGLSRLMEFPVAVTPYRWPVHGSYLRLYHSLGMARWLFRRTVDWYMGRSLPFTFLLHASDLADPDREAEIKGETGNHWSVETRLSLFRSCLAYLALRTRIVTTRDYLKSHGSCLAG